MYKILIVFATYVYLVVSCQSSAYPVFGTKRYHRATTNNVGSPSWKFLTNPSLYYNSYPQYYEDEAQYVSPSSNYRQRSIPADYYYYPRHEYHAYGLPTYQGDYKPSPYYYAAGPNYNYYDDREVSNNPLDDLHEEMMEEDERERYPGQENWYENSGQPDPLNNDFLRNLVAYDRKKAAEKQKGQLRPLQQQQQMQISNIADIPMEYDDYADLNNAADYEFEPQQKQKQLSQQSLKKQSLDGFYDTRKHGIKEKVNHEKIKNVDDENERQLKQLVHSSHKTHTTIPSKYPNHQTTHNHHNNHDGSKTYEHSQHNSMDARVDGELRRIDDDMQYAYDEPYQSWKHGSGAAYAPYDMDPEYEDDSWINWDRKRSSGNMAPLSFLPSLTNADSEPPAIMQSFNDRKPTLKLKLDALAKIASTTKPTAIPKNPPKSKSRLVLQKKSSSTSSTTSTTTTLKPRTSKKAGQKEVVLPRPANLASQRYLAASLTFNPPIGDSESTNPPNTQNSKNSNSIGIDSNSDDNTISDLDKFLYDAAIQAKLRTLNTERESTYDSQDIYATIKKIKPNIYDTIKQIIDMEEQLKEISTSRLSGTGSKLQKRSYVSNEENLVHELDNLKRRSV